MKRAKKSKYDDNFYYSNQDLPRCDKRIKVGPTAVDYNTLMYQLDRNNWKLLLLIPRYGLFGRLKGYFAYITNNSL